MLEQLKSTKSENYILWNRYSKVHGPKCMGKLPTEIKNSVSLRALKNIWSQQNASIATVRFVKLFYMGEDFVDIICARKL